MPEVGLQGQKKIAAGRVLIIGAGGLGTPVSVYLSSAGVGTIGVIDGDKVAKSNLSRQFLFGDDEVGQLKVTVLESKLTKQNSSAQVHTYAEMLNESNAEALIGEYDIVCDCTDNAQARILCDLVCQQLQKPLVYAVVRDWIGYVTVLHHRNKISLQQIFSHDSILESSNLNCSVAGIINTTCGIAGSIQAAEVIKILLDIPSELDGSILTFNSLIPVFRLFKLK